MVLSTEAVRVHSYRRTAPLTGAVCALLAACASACRSDQQVIDDQQRAMASLRATVIALGNAWLSGTISSTYARTALEATQQLVEKHRAELTATPAQLANPVAASLSDAENRLAHHVALLWNAIGDSDFDAVRRHLSAVAGPPINSP